MCTSPGTKWTRDLHWSLIYATYNMAALTMFHSGFKAEGLFRKSNLLTFSPFVLLFLFLSFFSYWKFNPLQFVFLNLFSLWIGMWVLQLVRQGYCSVSLFLMQIHIYRSALFKSTVWNFSVLVVCYCDYIDVKDCGLYSSSYWIVGQESTEPKVTSKFHWGTFSKHF